MGTVTYPHGGVERRLNESFVAFRPQLDQNEPLATKFLVHWTPGILVLDGLENVHHRAFGYHPPEDFEHLLDVGLGLIQFNSGNYKAAIPFFARAGEDAERTGVQPEALYWLGVSRYKSGDKDGLSKTWSRILDLYPQSLWAKRVSFIRPAASSAA